MSGGEVSVGLRVPKELFARRSELVDFVARAEDLGLDRLCVGDHVSFHDGTGYDGLIQSTALAALSSEIELMTSVYLLPLRHPVLVARQIASLCELAPGRFVFGVGIGGEDPHESAICGVDKRDRGRRVNESLALVRNLLEGEEVTFSGAFYQVEKARILPTPTPAVPVIVGGRSKAALRRAARSGEGWIGIWVTQERFAESIALVQKGAAENGRAEQCVRHGYMVWCGFADRAVDARPRLAETMQSLYRTPFDRFERYCPYGSPDEVAASLRPYVAAGARDLNLIAVSGSHEESLAGVAEVRRLLRLDRGMGSASMRTNEL